MRKSKKKLLYLCADTGIPYWGTKGGSIHMREFVANLKQLDYDITVVARGADSNGNEYESVTYFDLPPIPDDISENDLASSDGNEKIASEMTLFGHNTGIESLLSMLHSQTDFDLIYERYSLFCKAGLSFAAAHRLPYVLEVNAPLVNEAAEYRGLMLIDLAQSVEKRLFTEADHIVSVSDEVSSYIKSVAPEARVSVIPNGVTIERFTDINIEKASDLPMEPFNDTDFVVGFVGSLKPWHGVEVLINSFSKLPRDDERNRLLIVGGKGKQKSDLKEYCRELGLKGQAKFTGAVEHQAIPALLGMTDVLVAPYPNLIDFYFSALKIFEYMAAGKAIVASSIGQLEKILTHEKNALLVPPGDVDALRDALLRLKGDPDLRKRLGENARSEAVGKHSWKSRIETVSSIFENLTAKAESKKS